MSASLADAKRAFYRKDHIAQSYDRQRFGGVSGSYVNVRELALVYSLLPPSIDTAADVGTGTGRLLPLMKERAVRVLGLDASMPMLRQAGCVVDRTNLRPSPTHQHKASPAGAERATAPTTALVQSDAFALPLRDASLQAAACLRLLFHLDDPAPVLRELRRVVRADGVLVCDTSTWSPRGLLPLKQRAWGERVATMSRQQFRTVAQEAGWLAVDERPCFLISPYMYRLLPLPLARLLERLERHLPEQWLCRVFWRLKAA